MGKKDKPQLFEPPSPPIPYLLWAVPRPLPTVPNCSYKVYQFVKLPMLHLVRLPASVRFASFVFSALFRNTFVCSAAAGWLSARKPTGCRHCKLSFAFASCSNASSAAAAQLLAMVKRCSSQRRIASRLLCSLRDCVYLPFIFCILSAPPTSTPTPMWYGATTSGFGRRHVRSVFLLCYACRSTIAPLIALISDLK